jgi:DNA-binding NtrC family response regulator
MIHRIRWITREVAMTKTPLPVVMLVDDEPRILSALRRVLRREGFEILLIENARDALTELEAREIAVVVSDHKMPGISGTELLERVATRWPSTARILLSGWSSEVASEEIEAARLHAILTKPWDEEALKTTIQSAIVATAGSS